MTQRSAAELAITQSRICSALAVVLIALAGACAQEPPADRVRASGHVEATDVRLGAQVGGRLLELRVAEGDRVKAGDVIARLDTADAQLGSGPRAGRARSGRRAAAAAARGRACEDIRQAEAQAAERRCRRARGRRGARRRASRRGSFRSAARFQLGLAQAARRCGDCGAMWRGPARRARATASARRAKTWPACAPVRGGKRSTPPVRAWPPPPLKSPLCEKALADATIVSPIAGIVTEKLAEVGELLRPRAPVVVVADLEHVVGQRLRGRADRAAAPARPAGDGVHRCRRRRAAGNRQLHLVEGRVHAAQRADRRGPVEAGVPHQGLGQQRGRHAQDRDAGRSRDSVRRSHDTPSPSIASPSATAQTTAVRELSFSVGPAKCSV